MKKEITLEIYTQLRDLLRTSPAADGWTDKPFANHFCKIDNELQTQSYNKKFSIWKVLNTDTNTTTYFAE